MQPHGPATSQTWACMTRQVYLLTPSCMPQSLFNGVSFVVQCRFRPAHIPPGTPPTFHSCIIHDRQLKALLAAMGPSRPPGGAGGAGGRGHFGAGRGNTGSGRGASLHASGSRSSSSASMLLSHCFCRSMLAQQKHVEDMDCSSQGQCVNTIYANALLHSHQGTLGSL